MFADPCWIVCELFKMTIVLLGFCQKRGLLHIGNPTTLIFIPVLEYPYQGIGSEVNIFRKFSL